MEKNKKPLSFLMINWKEKQKIIIIFAVLLLFTASGLLTKLYDFVLYKPVKERCEHYLDDAFIQSRNLFISLSAAKATTAIIEGSTLNVNAVAGMNIETGDAIQPIYDAVDIAWKTSLLSITSIEIQRLFFELFKLNFLTWLLLIGFILLIPFFLHNNIITRILCRLAKIVLVLAFGIYLLFPIGILSVSKASLYLDKNYKTPAIEKLDTEVNELESITTLFMKSDPESEIKREDLLSLSTLRQKLGKKYSGFKDSFYTFIEKIKNISSSIVTSVASIVTIFVIEIIILPVLFLVIFWGIIKVLFWNEATTILTESGRKERVVPI